MRMSQRFHFDKKPIILITTSNIDNQQLGNIIGDTDIAYSDKATARAIIKAGGIPLYIPTFQSLNSAELGAYIELADGLVLPGADNNVDPVLYGGPVEVPGSIIDSQRDRIDIQLIRLAYKRGLPLLGICKGMQIMNVALGGSLCQKIPRHRKFPVDHNLPKRRALITHEATLTDGSFLREIFHSAKLGLNGGHQQAIERLSSKMYASAIAKDGIVEAYEGKDYPFLLGIQFHAELLESSPSHLAIFRRFINATSTYKFNKSMSLDD